MQETNQEIKLCKDCKYFYRNYNAYCRRQLVSKDFVDGTEYYSPCADQRAFPSKCGAEAKYFEPVEVISQSMITSVIKFFKGDKE